MSPLGHVPVAAFVCPAWQLACVCVCVGRLLKHVIRAPWFASMGNGLNSPAAGRSCWSGALSESAAGPVACSGRGCCTSTAERGERMSTVMLGRTPSFNNDNSNKYKCCRAAAEPEMFPCGGHSVRSWPTSLDTSNVYKTILIIILIVTVVVCIY